jgi:hypothetical protein
MRTALTYHDGLALVCPECGHEFAIELIEKLIVGHSDPDITMSVFRFLTKLPAKNACASETEQTSGYFAASFS